MYAIRSYYDLDCAIASQRLVLEIRDARQEIQRFVETGDEEVARKRPTTVVVACENEVFAQTVQTARMNDCFRVYTSGDALGVELGGALKNVLALAGGICIGLGLGDNALAALMTRGLAEMTRFSYNFV